MGRRGVSYHAYGSAAATYSLADTLVVGDAAKLADLPPADTVKLTPKGEINPKIARKQREAEKLREIARVANVETAAGMVTNTLPRFILPVKEGDEPKIADTYSPANERGAVVGRHFVKRPPHTVSEERLLGIRRAVEAVTNDIIDRCSGALRGRSYLEHAPKSWRADKSYSAFLQAVDAESRPSFRTMFVKANEALCKWKPRLIQAPSERTCMLQSLLLSPIEEVLFTDTLYESRSIKHANKSELERRMAIFIRRNKRVSAISVDFGSWDSTITNTLRAEIENNILSTLSHVLADSDELLAKAVCDRLKSHLRLIGRFHHLAADVFGRESGDRGTSTLNYLTNFILFLTLAEMLTGTSPADMLVSMRTGKPPLDIFIEGDDNVLLLTDKTIQNLGGVEATFEAVKTFYDDIGLNWEPASREGVVATCGREAIRNAYVRVEFVSRFFVFVKTTQERTRCVSVPKLSKALDSASVTFSQERLDLVTSSTAISGMYNSCSCPLLFGLFEAMYACAGVSVKAEALTSWKGRLVAVECEDRHCSPIDLVRLERQQAITDNTDHGVRIFLAREYPKLTVPTQERLEGEISAIARSFAAGHPNAWFQMGEWLSEFRSLLA